MDANMKMKQDPSVPAATFIPGEEYTDYCKRRFRELITSNPELKKD